MQMSESKALKKKIESRVPDEILAVEKLMTGISFEKISVSLLEVLAYQKSKLNWLRMSVMH